MNENEWTAFQRSLGASYLTTQDGQLLPAHYGNPHGEYSRGTTEAGLVDLGCRTQIRLIGKDARKFLHNFCTNEIRQLPIGRGCEAFITSIQSKVIAYIHAYALAEEIWISGSANNRESMLNHLRRYVLMDDVQIEDQTELFREILVIGPDAPARLEELGIILSGPPDSVRVLSPWGFEFHVRETTFSKFPGATLLIPIDRRVEVWEKLSGIEPIGSSVFHALRIESCVPWGGLDIRDDLLAQEVARTERCISYTKGCYLGQEPIARIDSMGHVNREMRGIRLDQVPVPPPGSPVTLADPSQIVGEITSSAHSFARDDTVALCLLKRNYAITGTKLFVQIGQSQVPGTVFWS